VCEEEALPHSVPLDPVFCASACVYVCVCVSPSVPLDPVQIIIFIIITSCFMRKHRCVCVCAGGEEEALSPSVPLDPVFCACACVYVCVCVVGGGFDHLLAAGAKARGALGLLTSSAVAAASRKNVQRRYLLYSFVILFYFRPDLWE
jgi:hypothetical protein